MRTSHYLRPVLPEVQNETPPITEMLLCLPQARVEFPESLPLILYPFSDALTGKLLIETLCFANFDSFESINYFSNIFEYSEIIAFVMGPKSIHNLNH